MPTTALKHLAKKANISLAQAELYWAKAKNIVKAEYGVDEEDGKFWALTTGIAKKMMGLSESISFKEFLSEAAVGKQPNAKAVSVEKAIALLNAHCKDALWMLHENKPIFRGDDYLRNAVYKEGFATVDPSKTVRKSENTSNYYTEIFDHHPEMTDFPKRSRSYIAATGYRSYDTAYNFGPVNILIPYDGVKIGCVNRLDIWDIHISFVRGDRGNRLEDINTEIFNQLFGERSNPWDELVKFDKSPDRDRLEYVLEDLFDNGHNRKELNQLIDRFSTNFLQTIFELYSLKNTKFTLRTTKDLKGTNGEIWIGGPCVVISPEMWALLRDAIKAKK